MSHALCSVGIGHRHKYRSVTSAAGQGILAAREFPQPENLPGKKNPAMRGFNFLTRHRSVRVRNPMLGRPQCLALKAGPENAGPARRFAPRALAAGMKSGLPQSVRTPTAWISSIKTVAETLAVRFLPQPSGLQQLDEMITRYRGQDHKQSANYFQFVAKLRHPERDIFCQMWWQ